MFNMGLSMFPCFIVCRNFTIYCIVYSRYAVLCLGFGSWNGSHICDVFNVSKYNNSKEMTIEIKIKAEILTQELYSAVGIATGYRLYGRWDGVRVPVGARSPEQLRGAPSLLSNGYLLLFPGVKAVGA
jgi:hypothetical protein